MVHGLEQIIEMNKNAEEFERAVKEGIVEPGVWRPLTIVERSRLNEKFQEVREVSCGPGFWANETERQERARYRGSEKEARGG